MSVLPVGFGSAVAGGYQIERSLRFNSADSAYLNRTFGTPTNPDKLTISFWVERGAISSSQYIWGSNNSGTNDADLYFNASDQLVISSSAGSVNLNLITTQVFRDPSAWYHIVVAIDTAQATSSDRAKLYVNGVQVTAFGTATYPAQNTDITFNRAYPQFLGCRTNSLGNFFNGYLTEINFIDGQALTPSSFGETDSATGVWEPKAYSGTYGTNGFYLKFADNSGTTSTTLGKDSSGNGNNWTPNNFSVTAGAGNDSLVDSPTAYGTDTGVGGEVRGNYCTWNPLRPNAAMSYTNGNLDATSNGGSGRSGYGTFGMSSGKWYFETTGGDNSVGIANISESVSATYSAAGSYNLNGTTVSGKATYTTTDLIGCAYDATNGTIEFFKNGVSQGSSSFSAGLGLDMVAQFNGTFSATRTCVANFGQRAFAYTAPSGFKALCTQNLPTPTIGATSTTQAGKYFNPVIYAGSASQQVIDSNLSVLDLAWIKNRTTARDHVLVDTVRGGSPMLTLYSNQTYAEDNSSPNFNPTSISGSSITLGGAKLGINNAGENFVMWGWNAGGSNATNTSGTITSTVRANTTSGFSIVTYTGTLSVGTNPSPTVGHGLGVAPSLIISKSRNVSAPDGGAWHVNHVYNYNNYLRLNTTAAGASISGNGGGTPANPTSTVFSAYYLSGSGITGNNYVAYCFAPVAGYSAFGSYTGNGSTDGPFVYTGFRPRYFMAKRTDAAGNSWILLDTARNTYNAVDAFLSADLSNAEATSYPVDFLSNGFKIRATTSNLNASSGTYIYMAFAESPFKYSLAR